MTGVLVDTSVWIDHFRRGNPALGKIIGLDRGLTHSMITLELACGNLPAPREQTLANIRLLPTCNEASPGEVAYFIEREKLYGLGCGFVDLALLASTLITPGAQVWTLDRRLNELAARFGIGYAPALH